MSVFAPTGSSMIVQLMGNTPQRVELPVTEGDAPVLRIASTAHPSSTAYAYIALGDDKIEASNQNSMAVDLTGRKDLLLGLTGAPSHLSLCMGGISQGQYTICITPGLLVG